MITFEIFYFFHFDIQNINEEKKEESEEYKIRNWMENTVKLWEYSEILIENGFDSMDSIIDITIHDLNEMGIHKIGHRRKIFKYAQKLAAFHQPQIPQQQQVNVNIAVWKCEICETQNANFAHLCKLCGLKKNYMTAEIEGSNIIDTTQ